MRTTSKLTSKHQVTLPDYVMEALDLKPADMVSFKVADAPMKEREEKTVVLIKEPHFNDFQGSLKSKKKFDIEAMDKAIEKHIVDNYKEKWNLS